MVFEWDEAKNKANIAKHGIDFSDVPDIFRHPMLPYAMIKQNMAKSVGSVLAG